jgi:polysaccharide biosynthesis/export protein
MFKLFNVLFLACCLIAGAASPAFAQDYILGVGDVVTVTVYDQPDLKSVVRISGDGMITLPLIGQINAAGLSVKKLSDEIETRLADGYLIHPQVTIFIEEFRSLKATILGGIRAPGLYELKGETTLLELISKAGGLVEDAANEAIIQRSHPNSQENEVITIDLNELLKLGQAAQNPTIINGDHIYIPKKKIFYVTGEIKNPNSYGYEEGITVIQALTKAGGLTDMAAPNRISIIRTVDGKEQVLKKVPMDERVLPNDVIVVPESYF